MVHSLTRHLDEQHGQTAPHMRGKKSSQLMLAEAEAAAFVYEVGQEVLQTLPIKLDVIQSAGVTSMIYQ